MMLKSKKRTYHISMNEKLITKTVDYCATLDMNELQEYIDDNFKKASKLGASHKTGAWVESKLYRDKAKIAIIEMENRRYG